MPRSTEPLASPKHDSAPSKPRAHQLDGLRGLAMILVFLAHFGTIWSGPTQTGDAVVSVFQRLVTADASLGTNFFMVLSGFFAYGSLSRGKLTFWQFLRNRVWRLYPLYAILSLVYIAGSLAIPPMSKLPSGGAELALFLVQTALILPGVLRVEPLMEVAWTLSFIVWFYFIEGAVVSLFAKLRLSRQWRFLLLLTAGLAWALVGHNTALWTPRSALFWIGMALSEAVSAVHGWRTQLARQLIVPATVLVVVTLVLRTLLILDAPDTGMVPPALIRVTLSAILLFCFVWIGYFGPDWWKRLLSTSQLRRLGQISYSFYLTHGFAVKTFRYGIVPQLGIFGRSASVFWVSHIAGLALAVAIAALVFRFIENPLATLTSPSRGRHVAATPEPELVQAPSRSVA